LAPCFSIERMCLGGGRLRGLRCDYCECFWCALEGRNPSLNSAHVNEPVKARGPQTRKGWRGNGLTRWPTLCAHTSAIATEPKGSQPGGFFVFIAKQNIFSQRRHQPLDGSMREFVAWNWIQDLGGCNGWDKHPPDVTRQRVMKPGDRRGEAAGPGTDQV